VRVFTSVLCRSSRSESISLSGSISKATTTAIAIPIPTPIMLFVPHRSAHIIKHPALPGGYYYFNGERETGNEKVTDTKDAPFYGQAKATSSRRGWLTLFCLQSARGNCRYSGFKLQHSPEGTRRHHLGAECVDLTSQSAIRCHYGYFRILTMAIDPL
jgi:hypothetical protein